VVKRRARIGPGDLFAKFAYHKALEQPPQQPAVFGQSPGIWSMVIYSPVGGEFACDRRRLAAGLRNMTRTASMPAVGLITCFPPLTTFLPRLFK
jgi:hypothetical protein